MFLDLEQRPGRTLCCPRQLQVQKDGKLFCRFRVSDNLEARPCAAGSAPRSADQSWSRVLFWAGSRSVYWTWSGGTAGRPSRRRTGRWARPRAGPAEASQTRAAGWAAAANLARRGPAGVWKRCRAQRHSLSDWRDSESDESTTRT